MTSLPSRWPSVEDGEMLRASSLVVVEQETCTQSVAQQLLGVSQKIFYQLLAQGQIRKVPIGTGRVSRYVMADLKAVARQRQVMQQDTCSLDELLRRLEMLPSALHWHIKNGHIHHAGRGRYFKAEVEALYEARHTQKVPNHLCTTVEAAKLLLRQRNQVLRYVSQGLLHPERVEGGDYLFSRAEVLAFQQQRLQASQHVPPDTDLYSALYSAFFTQGVQYVARHGVPWHEAEDMVQREFVTLWERPGDFFLVAPDLKSQMRLMMSWLKQARIVAARDAATHARRLQELAVEEVSWCRPHVPSVEQQVLDRERVQAMVRLAEARLPFIAQEILRWSLMGYGAIEIDAMVHEQYGVSWTLLQTKLHRGRVFAEVRSWLVQERA